MPDRKQQNWAEIRLIHLELCQLFIYYLLIMKIN